MRASFAVLFVAAACAGVPPQNPPVRTADSLAAALGNRIPGTPVTCINLHETRGSTLLPNENAVLFETRGDSLYLNRFRAECTNIRAGLALRTNTPAGRLCAGDIVEIFDPFGGFGHGACAMAEFIPYVEPT